jgi:hypothetical protein
MMFTTGELAVLRIVADEVRERGQCDYSLDEIAARAGVCRTLTKRTLRFGARHSLLRVTERPRPGKRHDTNLVEIVSAEWSAWLRRGPKCHPAAPFAAHRQEFWTRWCVICPAPPPTRPAFARWRAS